MPARSVITLQLALRLALAAVFVWAGAVKLADPASLAEAIANYRILPPGAVGAIALLVPATEIVVGLALLTGPYVQGAGLLAAGMLLAFAAAMAQAKLRGIDLECGCFGADSDAQVSWGKVVLNAGAACAALWVGLKTPARWGELASQAPSQVRG